MTFTYRARHEEADGANPGGPAADVVDRRLSPALLHVPMPQTRGVRSYGLYHPATLRPWPSVVRRLASRRWRRQQCWTGRRCVRSGGTPIRSGVPPVGSGSYAPGDPARGCAPATTGWGARGMKPTHTRRQGEIGEGWGLVWRWPRGVPARAGTRSGGSAGQVCTLRPHRGGWQGLWQASGRGGTQPKLHSASAHPVSGRLRTRSVQPSAIRSAQGRA